MNKCSFPTYWKHTTTFPAFWLGHKSEQANVYACPRWRTICWSQREPEPQLRTRHQTPSRERNLVKPGVVRGDTGGLCSSHKAALSGLGGLRPVAALAQTPVLTPPGDQTLKQWAVNGLFTGPESMWMYIKLLIYLQVLFAMHLQVPIRPSPGVCDQS